MKLFERHEVLKKYFVPVALTAKAKAGNQNRGGKT